ncbi:MAG: hypothetical protein E2O56_07100 [Gammaproteobacteria bacterium]|nr:MAG: hypothetical protein E2O56_07100 [Gammaproteobacteria bacterium]
MSTFPRVWALVVLALTIVGCGEAPTGGDSALLKVYRHSMDGSPTNLDPVQGSTLYTDFVIKNIYDTLYSYKYLKRPYELKPNLAVAMPEVSPDGLTYTIRIKQGVEFADSEVFPNGVGREVTARDFVYSLKRHFDPANRSQGAWLWQGKIVGLDQWKDAGASYDAVVSGLRALDDYTIQIQLTTPYPQLVFTLAMQQSAIVPREAVERYGREFGVNPVGSGPFTLKSFHTQRAVLTRNGNFRQEPVDIYYEGFDQSVHGPLGLEQLHGRAPPFVDRLEIQFIEQTAARWNSFTKGTEAQFTSVPPEQIDVVVAQKQPTVVLNAEFDQQYFHTAELEAGMIYQLFNMDDASVGYSDDPVQNERNKALRCAIRMGFNWPDRIDRFYYGIGQAYPGVIPPVVPEFDPNMAQESVLYDPDGARQLLAANGWNTSNLPIIEYGAPSVVTQLQMFEQFRGWMLNIGYPAEKIKLRSFATFGDFIRAASERKIMFLGMGWGLDYPDAQNTLQLFYGPFGAPGSNFANWVNDEFDALYDETAVMQPSAERTAMFREMNQMVVDECVHIGGFSRTRLYLWHRDVVMFPDRGVLGGYFLKYVDVVI